MRGGEIKDQTGGSNPTPSVMTAKERLQQQMLLGSAVSVDVKKKKKKKKVPSAPVQPNVI